MSTIETGTTPRVRPLAKDDLDAVVAIDAATVGRPRRRYFERRLAAALREPEFHVQFAVGEPGRLAGYVLARRLGGEFGRDEAGLRLEAIGVAGAERGHGAGHALMAALEGWARRHGVPELRTSARWTDHDMLRFLAHEGFALGASQIVACAVDAGTTGGAQGDAPREPAGDEAPREIDYSVAPANDFEALARDRCDVRTLVARELADIVRIDRRVTGRRDREDYIRRKVDEALFDSGIRVSLTAHQDGIVVGFVMASVDAGDFGRTDPVAVLDTIGVDPDFAHHGVGHALLSQLFVNLAALHVETIETIVGRRDFALLGFLYDVGFGPSQRLAFGKRI